MSELNFEIEHRVLRAMALLASTDKNRQVLNSVFVQLGENDSRVVATDGRIAGIYKLEEPCPVAGEVVLPVDWLRLFSWRPNHPKVQISVNDTSFTVAYRKQQLTSEKITGNYPNYRQVVPTGEFGPINGFNYCADLCSKFLAVSKILLPRNGCSLRIRAHADDQPYSVFIGHPNFYGILMPLKADETKVPDWARK